MKQPFQFPKSFLWGASTSSHQVEGGLHNSWTRWEQSDRRLSELREHGLIKQYGKQQFISGKAVDHYHRFRDDFRLAQSLGHNATRFSLEWSRIEPREGEFDEKALAHYVTVLKFMRSLGIEPFVTLWHWPLPIWLEDKGGCMSPEIADYFARYATKLADALGDHVTYWITLNEPEIFSDNSYLAGIWPPQRRSPILYLRVLHHLVSAHKQAYIILKGRFPASQVGIATNNAYIETPYRDPVHLGLRAVADWWNNHWFLSRIKQHQDFIGLNYYFHNRIAFGFGKNQNLKTSDLGWELYPEGIYPVLKDLQRYNVPIYITEHGLADAADRQRGWYIVESLRHIHRAIIDGVDVRGYLHWSLIDNFEWDKGFWPRFGLIAVDFKTQRRTIRPSAQLYKAICESNGVTEKILDTEKELQ
ncbi:MAG: glycoside hydrolase family 1 protein [Patescibacteria group bacterium]